MKKSKGIMIEFVFYSAIIIYTVMKYLDVHFINKTLGQYMFILFGVINLVYFMHINRLPKSKKKMTLLIIFPFAIIFIRSIFMLVGIFSLSFTVFKFYERTRFNRFMKLTYGICVFCTFLVFANIVTFYSIAFQKDDRYEGYEFSPDETQIVTMIYVGNQTLNPEFSYSLEKTYLKTFRKKEYEITSVFGRSKHEVEWLSDSKIMIDGKIFEIK